MAGVDRVTVPDAAERLGLSENAVRKRVQRDTIQWDRDEDGRVYVYLPPTITDQAADHANGQVGDQVGDQSPLIERMASEIEFLRGELQRKDAILLSMTEGLKSLEAPQGFAGAREAQDGDLTAFEEPGGVRGRPVSQKPEQRRSWLYRFFFGP